MTIRSAVVPRIEAYAKVLPILVLYRCPLPQSSTYNTLLSAGLAPNQVAVYDNSPLCQIDVNSQSQLLAHRHDPANGGLAAAYNWAAKIAQAQSYSWILLLDQDSELPPGFFPQLEALAAAYADDDTVAAIVPWVRTGGAVLSPKAVRFGRLAPLPGDAAGAWPGELMAINSGTAVKLKFLRDIGGFSPLYPLDFLDHWLFHMIYKAGKKTVISRWVLDHDLSMQHYDRVDSSRYRSLLSAEAYFVAVHKPALERLLYWLRLWLRAIKQVVITGRFDLAAQTVSAIVDRRKKYRRMGDGNLQ